jgi:hypothetical protein
MRIALSKAVIAASLLTVGGFSPVETEAENERNGKVEIASTGAPLIAGRSSLPLKDSILREILRVRNER